MREHLMQAELVQEAERPEWERSGWTRAPRNSHEVKMIRAGKHQPVAREDKRAVKICRRLGPDGKECGSDEFEPYMKGDKGKTYERCVVCRRRTMRAYRRGHLQKFGNLCEKYANEMKKKEIAPDTEGPTEISMTWFVFHKKDVQNRVVSGESFVVKLFDAPLFAIIPVEAFNSLPMKYRTGVKNVP